MTALSRPARGGTDGTLVVEDLNADGRVDLAVTNTTSIAIYYANSSGGFDAPVATAAPSFTSLRSAGDVNQDGNPDLLATSTWQDTVLMIQ